jgi:hypothetical protein
MPKQPRLSTRGKAPTRRSHASRTLFCDRNWSFQTHRISPYSRFNPEPFTGPWSIAVCRDEINPQDRYRAKASTRKSVQNGSRGEVGRAGLGHKEAQQTEKHTLIPKVKERKNEYRPQSRVIFIRRILTVSSTRPKGGRLLLRNECNPVNYMYGIA